jgi:DNA-directed RNA polymerase specialized sigma subunit
MTRRDSIHEFIVKFAAKIEQLYPNSYSDVGDYIQEGHLKLAQIRGCERNKRDFFSYAITCVARAMRKSAIASTCAASAPHRIKWMAHKIDSLLSSGSTEQEVCKKLRITIEKFVEIKKLSCHESWNMLFEEPAESADSFSFFDDILESQQLTDEDVVILRAQLENAIDDLGLDRNQLYRKMLAIRPKLIRSGYGY